MAKKDNPVEDAPVKAGDTFLASFDVEVLKAETSEDGDKGHVEAIVSAYGVPYRMGFMTLHNMQDGAFSASIDADPVVPVFWQHNWDWSEQPPIGTGDASEVTAPKAGLKIAADFFLDSESGRSVFNSIKAKALKQWSIGYRITKFNVEEDEKGFRVINIEAADLLEASSVLRGANPDTETLKVASVMPESILDVLTTLSSWMQEQKTVNDSQVEVNTKMTEWMGQVGTRMDCLEDAHELLVGLVTDEDKKETPSSGESVEPAVHDGDEVPREAATNAPQAPDSPADLDALFAKVSRELHEKRQVEIEAKRKEIIEKAGLGLPADGESDFNSIEAIERVMRCTNKVRHLWESTEQRTEAESLASS